MTLQIPFTTRRAPRANGTRYSQLTAHQSAAYVRGQYGCPFCRCSNTSAEPEIRVDAGRPVMLIIMRCLRENCRREWVERFTLTSIEDRDEACWICQETLEPGQETLADHNGLAHRWCATSPHEGNPP